MVLNQRYPTTRIAPPQSCRFHFHHYLSHSQVFFCVMCVCVCVCVCVYVCVFASEPHYTIFII